MISINIKGKNNTNCTLQTSPEKLKRVKYVQTHSTYLRTKPENNLVIMILQKPHEYRCKNF